MKTETMYSCDHCLRSFATKEECLSHEKNCATERSKKGTELANEFDKLFQRAQREHIKIDAIGQENVSGAIYNVETQKLEFYPF